MKQRRPLWFVAANQSAHQLYSQCFLSEPLSLLLQVCCCPTATFWSFFQACKNYTPYCLYCSSLYRSCLLLQQRNLLKDKFKNEVYIKCDMMSPTQSKKLHLKFYYQTSLKSGLYCSSLGGCKVASIYSHMTHSRNKTSSIYLELSLPTTSLMTS